MSPALPLAFRLALPGGGFQPGLPLSDGSPAGLLPAFPALFDFHTVPVYYHIRRKVSRESRPVRQPPDGPFSAFRARGPVTPAGPGE